MTNWFQIIKCFFLYKCLSSFHVFIPWGLISWIASLDCGGHMANESCTITERIIESVHPLDIDIGVNGWTCLAVMLKRVLLWFYLGLHFCSGPNVSSICQGLTSTCIIRSYVPICLLNSGVCRLLKCWTNLQQFSNMPFFFQHWCLCYGLLNHPLSTGMWTLMCICLCSL